MAETPSTMIALGTKAPDFDLFDVRSGKNVTLKDIKSPVATVVMFICNHCPYVKHIQQKLAEIAKNYQQKNVSFVAINSNDIEAYPSDSPENMIKQADTVGFSFPYLLDETQSIAKAYKAACTPDFYIFDKNLACVYRGRFDAATPVNEQPVTGHDLIAALDNLIAGKQVSNIQYPSLGCNIKWRQFKH